MRLLLICFCGAIIVTCIGTLVDASYYLIAIISKVDIERCTWLSFTISDCIALRNVYYLGLLMVVISTLFLAIERAVATLLYQTYERSTRKWISISMALSQLYRKSQNENVSVRYQLRENVATSRLMVPLVTIVTALVLTAILLHVVLPSRQNTDNYWINIDQLIIYCFFAEIQACFTPIASVILAIALCYTSKTIQSSLFHLLGLECCIRRSQQNSIHASPDEFIRRVYFDQLHRQWNDLPCS
uniref:G-protein coupled receptors family 1 profile domain-containing protein n=1 Tax=Setaria digitata TaxID=48799 RepID=A0A915PMN1_9BILA